MTRFIKKSMYLVILMSRFRPAMMHLVQSYDDRDNGTEGVHVSVPIRIRLSTCGCDNAIKISRGVFNRQRVNLRGAAGRDRTGRGPKPTVPVAGPGRRPVKLPFAPPSSPLFLLEQTGKRRKI